jgi:hypothetical protein
MATDGKNFFLCFLAIWISSFEKLQSTSVTQLFIGSLIFLESLVF